MSRSRSYSAELAETVRAAYRADQAASVRRIAERYGLSRSTVARILARSGDPVSGAGQGGSSAERGSATVQGSNTSTVSTWPAAPYPGTGYRASQGSAGTDEPDQPHDLTRWTDPAQPVTAQPPPLPSQPPRLEPSEPWSSEPAAIPSGLVPGAGGRWHLSPESAGRLQGWRRRAGLTQAELAERAGCGTSWIGKLEQGRGAPSVDTAEALAFALRLSDAERDQLVAETVPGGPPRHRPE